MKVIANDAVEVVMHEDVVLDLLSNQKVNDKDISFTCYEINLHKLRKSFIGLAKKYVNVEDYHRLAELGHIYWFILDNIMNGDELIVER